MKIGIMGGTFNPIHVGHLWAAEEAREEFSLNEIIFVPSAQPPHKDNVDIADPFHRYMMVVLATIDHEKFTVSDIEIKREGKSYTEETILEFKRIYGEDTEIYFITGADALSQIHTWKNAKNLPHICKFIAVNRPGYSLKVDDYYKKSIYELEISPLAVSSTQIRKRLKEGKTIRFLVPKKVEEYIYKNGLYHTRQQAILPSLLG